MTELAVILAFVAFGSMGLAGWALWLLHRERLSRDVNDAKDLAAVVLEAYEDGRQAREFASHQRLATAAEYGRVRKRAQRQAARDAAEMPFGQDEEGETVSVLGETPTGTDGP